MEDNFVGQASLPVNINDDDVSSYHLSKHNSLTANIWALHQSQRSRSVAPGKRFKLYRNSLDPKAFLQRVFGQGGVVGIGGGRLSNENFSVQRNGEEMECKKKTDNILMLSNANSLMFDCKSFNCLSLSPRHEWAPLWEDPHGIIQLVKSFPLLRSKEKRETLPQESHTPLPSKWRIFGHREQSCDGDRESHQ